MTFCLEVHDAAAAYLPSCFQLFHQGIRGKEHQDTIRSHAADVHDSFSHSVLERMAFCVRVGRWNIVVACSIQNPGPNLALQVYYMRRTPLDRKLCAQLCQNWWLWRNWRNKTTEGMMWYRTLIRLQEMKHCNCNNWNEGFHLRSKRLHWSQCSRSQNDWSGLASHRLKDKCRIHAPQAKLNDHFSIFIKSLTPAIMNSPSSVLSTFWKAF